MTLDDLEKKLAELRALPAETEWVEFKEAKASFDLEKLGQYFSALANEANLKGQRSAWLVFGVKDKVPRDVIGTEFKRDSAALDALKKFVADHTSQRITFVEIHELLFPDGRVLMFEIPAAPKGVPTSWKGHYHGRDGESLGPLNAFEYELIRSQATTLDWSAQVIEGASLDDLDQAAITFARTQFKTKFPHLTDEPNWGTMTFLNKARVCVGGRLTRTALLLLGKAESAHLLSPAQAQITWVLRDGGNTERDYQHFGPPLILASDSLLQRVRNLTIRHLPKGTLFPQEVTQYDAWVIRETLHNCIAHQDYSAGARINVVETNDSLLFTNRGAFIPGSVERMIEADAPPDVYRNPFLAAAMVSLNMIDTIGSGIKRMFQRQRERSFPLPDYELSEPDRVAVRLSGRILDENYTRLLLARSDLALADVIALDKVQKHRPIDDVTFARLKKRRLVEGRRTNLYVAASLAVAADAKAEFIKNRAFDKEHYRKMVVAYIESFGEASLDDMRKLLVAKLSDALSDGQKQDFVRNLLQAMRREGVLTAVGHGRTARWALAKSVASSEALADVLADRSGSGTENSGG